MTINQPIAAIPPRPTHRGVRPHVVLLAVLIGLAVGYFAFRPRFGSNMTKGPIAVAKTQMDAFSVALDMFKTENGSYPANLQALVTRPADAKNWHQYLNSIPLDPWGHVYIYNYPSALRSGSFDLISVGPDGKPGTKDDLIYGVWNAH